MAPLLVFLGEEVEYVKPIWVVRPFLFALLFGLSLAFVCRRLFRNAQLGMVFASLIAILLLGSGYLPFRIAPFLFVIKPAYASWWLEQTRQPLIWGLLLAIQVFLCAVLVLGLRKRPKYVEKLVVVFNILALAILIGSSIAIASKLASSKEIVLEPAGISAEEIDALTAPDPLPDIYFIVLDSYPARQILQEEFGYDNSAFLGFLEDRDFTVNDASKSNYIWTGYTVASTLNMDYIHEVAERSGVHRPDGFNLTKSIRENAIRAILSQFGYKTVAFSSGFVFTDVSDVDVYYADDRGGLNPLEVSLLPGTVYSYLVSFLDNDSHSILAITYTSHIARIEDTLDNLGTLGVSEDPMFVIAHIILPHPPFVYGADGTITIPPRPFSLFDAGRFPGSAEEYQQGLVDQIIYLNERLRSIIDSILTESHRPTIIIMQGDHGARWKCNLGTCEDLRGAFSILDARYLPGVVMSEHDTALTPVNIFRLILNEYFGGHISYLPDNHYIAEGDMLSLESFTQVQIPEDD